MPSIRVKRKQTPAGGETLKPGELGVMGDYLYYGNRGANDDSDNTPLKVARDVDAFPVSATAYHVLAAPTSNGQAAYRAITAAYVSLGNVTNNAQVKKRTSSTSGSVPTWDGATGDALNDGYTVQTTLSSSATALVRADAIVTALGNKLNVASPVFTGTMSGPYIVQTDALLEVGSAYTGSGLAAKFVFGDGTIAATAANGFTAPTPSVGDNSTKVATTAYVKAEITSQLGSVDAMHYKGVINCSTNPNYPAANAGDVYKVSVAGKIGGASGVNVTEGDTLICTVDSSAAGTHATVGTNWNILQANVDGMVTGPGTTTSGYIPTWSNTLGTTLGTGYAVTDSSSASAIGTGTSLVTERDIYYGLPTINNAHNYTSSTTIYAPAAGGTSGHLLIAQGATSAPTWRAGTSADVGLGNVTNESKATMFTNPTFTGTVVAGNIQRFDNNNIVISAGDSGMTYVAGITFTAATGVLALTTTGGSVTAPTVTSSDNSTKVATTAFVKGQGYVTSSGVTSVTASGALSSSGGTTPAITHSVADGYIHLPAGGATGNILLWASAGTASWSSSIDAGAWA